MKGARDGFINYLASAMIGFIICFSTPEIDFPLLFLRKAPKQRTLEDAITTHSISSIHPSSALVRISFLSSCFRKIEREK